MMLYDRLFYRICQTYDLRTFLFPTRMMGTFGQKCLTSGVHFSGMFSSESIFNEISNILRVWNLTENRIKSFNNKFIQNNTWRIDGETHEYHIRIRI